jgi:hypothetical protein
MKKESHLHVESANLHLPFSAKQATKQPTSAEQSWMTHKCLPYAVCNGW